MGTEVLRPHECLERVRVRAAKRSPRRQPGRPTARRAAARQAAPSSVARQVRVKVVADADAYAGTAFGAMSPSPRALPLPRFSSSSTRAGDPAAGGVDDSATRELRRLLGLH